MGLMIVVVYHMKFSETRFGNTGAQTLTWVGDDLVDWVSGRVFRSGEKTDFAEGSVPYKFDSVLTVPDGKGYVLYERLGTKALLLYEGRIVREFNRSYYQAGTYDYPICTSQLENGRQILAHCPEVYSRLEIEDLFTGESLTSRVTESPDFFHSRLQISPDKKWVLSAGWQWNPIDALKVFALDKVMTEPELLDAEPAFKILNPDLEVQSAVFTPDSNILIVTADEDDYEELEDDETFYGMKAGQVALFSPAQKKMLWTQNWTTPPGRIEVAGLWALCLYEHPRLYRWSDWTFIHEWPHLKTGKQNSSIATIGSQSPATSFQLDRGRFAISSSDGITVVQACG